MEDEPHYALWLDPHTAKETSMIGKSTDSEMAIDKDRVEIERKSKISWKSWIQSSQHMVRKVSEVVLAYSFSLRGSEQRYPI